MLSLVISQVICREFKEYVISNVAYLKSFGFEKGGMFNIKFDIPYNFSLTAMLARIEMLNTVNETIDPCYLDKSLLSKYNFSLQSTNNTFTWSTHISEKGIYTPVLLMCSEKRRSYHIHYVCQNPSSFLDFREYDMPKHLTVLSILLGVFALGMFISLYYSRHTFYLLYYLLAASASLYALWQSYLAYTFIEIDKNGKLETRVEIIEMVLFVLSNSSFLALLILGGSGFSTLSATLKPEYIFKVFANSIIFTTLMRIREFTKKSFYADFTTIIIMFASGIVFFKWFSSSLNHVIFDTAEMYSTMWKKANLAHFQNVCVLLAVFHCLSYALDAFTGSLASYVFPAMYYFITSIVLFPRAPIISKPKTRAIIVDGPVDSSLFVVPL